MLQSESVNELFGALAKAQANLKPAHFNKTNPHFKSKYADMTAVLEAVRGPLAEQGLSITQTTELRGENSFCLVTRLCHTSGQYIASEYPLPQTARPQELGSALTYARRYSLSAIACIAADEDDDAEGARQGGQVATMKRGNTDGNAPTNNDPVSDEQAKKITALITETKSNPNIFLKWIGAESVSDIPAHKYAAAIAGLEAKKRS